MKLPLVLVVALFGFMMVLPTMSVAQTPPSYSYSLIVDCVQAKLGAPGQIIRCPVRAEDLADMMGSPSVAVDIRNPNLLVMASLHGQDRDGPTERSRGGLPYTTYTSTDGGRSWRDNFFPGPPDVQGSFGEHPQIVTDPYGHVYIGSLWARSLGASEWQYILSAQKFENLQSVNGKQVSSRGGYNVQYIDPFYKGNAINQYWYIFNPRTDNMTIVWHETPSPMYAPKTKARQDVPFGGFHDLAQASHSHGDVASKLPPLWKNDPITERFSSPGSAEAPFGKHVISFVWTNMTMKSRYHYALEENIIGPCAASTNPVWSEGWLYVGCVTDPDLGPFKWNKEARKGYVELFRFMPETGLPPQYLGQAPIEGGMDPTQGGTPKLGVRSDGRLALFSASIVEKKVHLIGAFGQYDDGRIDWDDPKDYSKKLPQPLPNEAIVATNIQDLEYREYSGAVHLILKEEVSYLSLPEVDGVPTVTGPGLPKYRKTLVALDERYGFLTHYKFDIGRLSNRTDPALYSAPEENYNDLSDDLVQHPPRPFSYNDYVFDDLYQREFFAVGDYGIIIFAEIIEITDIRPPGVPSPPPGPPPVPAPALAASPTMVILPMAGTTMAGMLAFALLSNKRKNPLTAITRGE